MAGTNKTEIFSLPIEKIYRVITDYPSYPEYMDGVDKAHIIELTESGAIVEYSLNIIRQFSYQLEMIHQHPHKISWTLLSGDLFKKNEGYWELKALNDDETQLTYSIDAEFKLLVPKMIINKIIKNNLPKLFNNIHHRAKNL